MLSTDVTAVVLTWNEGCNLKRCLQSLAWAPEIVIVDSGSTDETAEIARCFSNARLLVRTFDNHTNQWNFGIAQVRTEWVLALDADYVCPPNLQQELASLDEGKDVYFARFRYLVNGIPLRATLYPPRAVLFRCNRFRYVQDGHTQLLDTGSAPSGFLLSVIDHDDRKPLSRWLLSQKKYAELEAAKLLSGRLDGLSWKDRLRRKIVLAPLLNLFYCLFVRRLVLDGWAGIFYALQRTYAELLLSLELLDLQLRASTEEAGPRSLSHAAAPAAGAPSTDMPSTDMPGTGVPSTESAATVSGTGRGGDLGRRAE